MTAILTQFIFFVIYSFIGWICETIFCSVAERRFINRGFLNGPFCPIYGTGAILVLTLFSWCKEHILLLFILSILVTGVIEYITSYLLESIFHLQLWDYSKNFCNINGRVCLRNAILFGIMSVLLVELIHPHMLLLFGRLPQWVLLCSTGILTAYFIVDTIFTAKTVLQINHKAGQRQMQLDELSKLRNLAKQKLQGAKPVFLSHLHEELESKAIVISVKEKLSHRRFLKAFPSMRSKKYQDAINEFKSELKNKIHRKGQR